ncbi:MAG: glycosyltransferase family 4 protein [Pseudomonadota bacterium]
MDIALVLETSGGGSGRHVLDIAEAFVEMGHRVTVFWSAVRAEPGFVARLTALEEVKQVEVAMQRAVGLADIGQYLALRKALKAHGPFDVIHAHSSKAGALVRLDPMPVAPVCVYTPHALRTMDPDISAMASAVYGRIEKVLSRRSDMIISVSAAERAHAVDLGIDSQRIKVVANGARPASGFDRAAARKAMAVDADAFVVGFAGRLVGQKDPLRFVDAIAEAATHIANVRGVIMGDGELMNAAQKRAQGAPVTFMGWCDAPALMAGLDVLCVTSRYEALPYTFLEALHAGIPIVSADVGGVAETVIDGKTGIVVPVNSTGKEFAQALATLADSETRAAYCAAAATLAKARTVTAMAEATLDVYRAAGAPDGPQAVAETPTSLERLESST